MSINMYNPLSFAEAKPYGVINYVSIGKAFLNDLKASLIERYNAGKQAGDQQVMNAAREALRRFKALTYEDTRVPIETSDKGKTLEERKEALREEIKNRIWAPDEHGDGRYYTQEEKERLGLDIQKIDQQLMSNRVTDSKGRLYGYKPASVEPFRQSISRESLVPLSFSPGKDEDGNPLPPIGGIPLRDYITGLLSSNPEERKGITVSGDFNPDILNHYRFTHKFDKGIEEYVVGQYTGAPGQYDEEYNVAHKNSIASGQRRARYAGPHRYVIVKQVKDGNIIGYRKIDLDRIPDLADHSTSADYYTYDYLPQINRALTQDEISQILHFQDMRGPWGVVSEKESGYRMGRSQPINLDEDGKINVGKLLKSVQYNTKSTGPRTKGQLFDEVTGIDPTTGHVYTSNHRNFLNLERNLAPVEEPQAQNVNEGEPLVQQNIQIPANGTPITTEGEEGNFARGGSIRVPKHLRDAYGRKLVRVPGWGDDDTDVYSFKTTSYKPHLQIAV